MVLFLQMGGRASAVRRRGSGLRFQMLETLRAPDVWAAVEVVAAELLQRNTLRGVEVRALVNQQGAKSQFSGEVVPALSRAETYDRLGLYPEP